MGEVELRMILENSWNKFNMFNWKEEMNGSHGTTDGVGRITLPLE